MRKQSLPAYLSILRPVNSVMAGCAVLVGEMIALKGTLAYTETILGFCVATTMMASTMALNDAADLPIDRINAPYRPLPSGALSIRQAYMLSATLASVALLGSVPLNFPLGLGVATLALVLMIYYNFKGKRKGFYGNLIVSFEVALLFLYGGVIVANIRPILLVFFAIAFLANLGREIVKGIVDLEGDARSGVRTVAVTHGPRRAAQVSVIFVASAIIFSLIPILTRPPMVGSLYLLPLTGCLAGFAYSSYSIMRDYSPLSARRVKNHLLAWMVLGLSAFLLGTFQI